MKRLTPIVVVLAVVLLASPHVGGREANAAPPEMKELYRLTGNWINEAVARTTEGATTEKREKGTSRISSIMEGRFVLGRGFDADGRLANMHMLTYDVKRQEYRQWSFDAKGITIESSGKWDASAKTFTFTGEIEGITATTTFRFTNPDNFQWSVFFKDGQGKVVADVQGKSTRQE